MEQAISHGLTYFRLGNITHYFDGLLNKMKLDDELKQPLRQWFLKEVKRYMTEKGVRLMIAGRGDELSEKELYEGWLPWAKEIKEAGIDCTSTFSWKHSATDQKKLVDELNPYIKLWTLNQGLVQDFLSEIKNGTFKIRPDAIVGTYGAGEGRGSEFRKQQSRSRYLGWLSWKLGLRDCMPNPYFKSWIYYCDYGDYGETGGIAGERWVSFINKDDLSVPVADCPFWEGIREGLEEGNLAQLLTEYLNKLEKLETVDKMKIASVREKLQALMSDSDNAVIKWTNTKNGQKSISAGNPDYRKAKRIVLELLTSIAEIAQKNIKPTVFWNDLVVVENGKSNMTVYIDKINANDLINSIKNKTGIDIPVKENAENIDPSDEIAIVIGNSIQNPLSKNLLTLPENVDTEKIYSKPGSYFIKELVRPDKQRIFILAGPDEAGTLKAVDMFTKFLKFRGNNFRLELNETK